MFKKLLLLSAISLINLPAFGDEASVKALLLKKYQSLSKETIVKKLPINGIYEVNLLGQEAYTNEKVEFLFVGGSLINTATLTDVTAERKNGFLHDFYKNLPFPLAIKTVYGQGENELVAFEDPDCPLCQAQQAEWAKNAEAFNATVYTFMFPLKIHPDARKKAEFIMCEKNNSVVWRSWMEKKQGLNLDKLGNIVEKGPACEKGINSVKTTEALARSLGYHETPRFIFANGMGASSVLTIQQFQDAFKMVNESEFAKKPTVSDGKK